MFFLLFVTYTIAHLPRSPTSKNNDMTYLQDKKLAFYHSYQIMRFEFLPRNTSPEWTSKPMG